MAAKCYPRLREKGQITIPKDIRCELGLEVGDRIELTIRHISEDE
ncbi:AbrB/MazE/SpoVT family DNA-binding domain-containing protein [Halalkalicoccus tibetensis]|uniref:AbrB/MazE/SpoVT family DNA-binding domain-containing protein n=1 Tax=Halalkalicoccus tibetensis TaxID=175632 RepID=A0ABD5VB98_9EURY